MNTDITRHFLDWLRDAHAMEKQKEILLKGQIDRLASYPEIQTVVQKYLEVTRSHQISIQNAIERLGGDTSILKDIIGKLMAAGQNLVGTAMSDEVVKSLMTIYVFTNVAISSYKVLISAADFFSDDQIRPTFDNILGDEVAMNEWLAKKLPESTKVFLARSLKAEEATSN